jgi:hypothetical protein
MAPGEGLAVTADFSPADHMAVTIETYQLHNWQQIPIVELRS